MTASNQARGGATVNVLNRMEAWEAHLILNLRLWCEGPTGQHHARQDYLNALPAPEAERAWAAFQRLTRKILCTAPRPLVRHDVGCNCVGSDECVFVHLVRTASDGHLNDAALIATLLTGPAYAEHIALMAGEVGSTLRHIHDRQAQSFSPANAPNVVRLH
ncbi:hypothetical protein [Tateyamaria omphalii]|uniref:Uncharacterized protein n=1 Tax=Tateyamaria omphalii TaxID=299262 RepID=A0A1P8N179_9RHOB|nr:hypothetical protein [Tateyamaria omphalii]APX14081.1 hypothetical protein BWR18_19650 [Tateyamaria omphalii]